MNAQRRDFLTRLWNEGREFDARQPDRLDRRRNLEPESAQLLNILIRTLAPSALLELGTSKGSRRSGWRTPSNRPAGR